MSKTMAEVLAEHRISPDFECECGTDFYPQSDDPDAPDAAPDAFGTAFEAHQAAALSAAGFGLVADAKAEEWGVRWQAAGPFPEEVHAKPSKDAAEKSLASSAFPGVIVRRTVSEWEAAQ